MFMLASRIDLPNISSINIFYIYIIFINRYTLYFPKLYKFLEFEFKSLFIRHIIQRYIITSFIYI